jgi:hypothetical protein
MAGSKVIGQGTLKALNDTVELSVSPELSTGGIVVSGAWVGAIAFQGSIDGLVYDPIPTQPVGGGVLSPSTTVNGRYLVNLAGFSMVRVRMAVFTSGSAEIWGYGTESSVFIRSVSTLAGATDSSGIGNIGNSLRTSDVLNSAIGTQGALSIGTDASEVKVGNFRLIGRKSLSVYNNGSVVIYWGYNPGVTTATGTPIGVGQYVSFKVGDNQGIYLISGSIAQDVRVTEG